MALTHSNRTAILSIIVFFVAGGALLVTVDIEEGRRAAERCATVPGAGRQGLAIHPFGVLLIGHTTCCGGPGDEVPRLNSY